MTSSDWLGAILLFGPAVLLAPLPWVLRAWRPAMRGAGRVALSLLVVGAFAALELTFFDQIVGTVIPIRADPLMVVYHVIFGLLVAAVVVLISGILSVLVKRPAA
ncbi:hypothetical protein ATO6_04935 [Oceanicola sp. 22II-s10i]|uniref:hypothetical protein n=1 Tax=Oceanicola sp. 22II-s10i TaxID=1317116 RepID=UPI000B526D81|nr:hypothetical protein [Oceanicola sp. 22II-s10i]OWU86196.1 hypothetical protein ATO6_04935 [Oceanicola sp. 22II-s10i]